MLYPQLAHRLNTPTWTNEIQSNSKLGFAFKICSVCVGLGWRDAALFQLWSWSHLAERADKWISKLLCIIALGATAWTCLGFHGRPWHRHRQKSPLMWPTWHSQGQISLSSSSLSTATAGALLVHLITLLRRCKIYLFNICNTLLRAFKIILQVQCLFLRIILLFCNVS